MGRMVCARVGVWVSVRCFRFYFVLLVYVDADIHGFHSVRMSFCAIKTVTSESTEYLIVRSVPS